MNKFTLNIYLILNLFIMIIGLGFMILEMEKSLKSLKTITCKLNFLN